MPVALVADDEPRYREHLQRILADEGYDVHIAADGREAVLVGSTLRPDLMVLDWMLLGNVHGLHVADAVRVLRPDVQTILITGYPSSDLMQDARRRNVAGFIEKPFETQALLDAVRTCRSAAPTAVPASLAIGVFEIDSEGTVRFANPEGIAALRTFHPRRVVGESDVQAVSLGDAAVQQVRSAEADWVSFSPGSGRRSNWQVRSRGLADDGGWLVVLVPEERRHYRNHLTIRLLLDLQAPLPQPWPLSGRVLVADSDEWVWHVLAAQIEHDGGVCHSAETVERALDLAQRDGEIGAVIIDHDLAGDELPQLLARLRELHPHAQFVGTGCADAAGEYAECGVALFIQKPWTVRELMDLLNQPLGRCRWCGQELPLRRPDRGETPARWMCVNCGRTVLAVLDKSAPAAAQSNAAPVEYTRRAASQS